MVNELNPPRIESLTVRNDRAQRHITFEQLTPLTVLLGPNHRKTAQTGRHPRGQAAVWAGRAGGQHLELAGLTAYF